MSQEQMQPVEFGKYKLIRRIAVGGMAQIYLAVQRGPHGFEKVAVLKVILPELCQNDEFVQMFLDEARIAANLDHTNVVRIYDFGEFNGQYYLAMEHLPGEDLVSLMQTCKRAQKMVPVELAVETLIGAATGLHFAHELADPRGRPLNVVHRDVSPSNILVTYHGSVKVLDFGIARAESNITRTAAGTLKGKVAYCSPEQARGEVLDRRSDIFALGTVLYELLTLRRPFKRDSDLATLQAVVDAPFPRPSELRPEVPPELDAIVMKAMARELPERYQTMAEFADDLAHWLVSRGWVRSDKHLADFLAASFDPERRLGKLRVAQATSSDGEPLLKTPSQLKHLPQHLSPIRSNPSMPAVEIEDLAPADLTADLAKTKTDGKAMALALAKERTRRPLIAGAAAVGVLVLAGGGYLAFRSPPTPPVAQPTPPVAQPTPPVAQPTQPTPPVVPPTQLTPPIAQPTQPTGPTQPTTPKTVTRAAKGKLTLDTTPWSEVYLKGRKLGDTPLVDYALAPGIHVLTLVNEAKSIRKSVEVEVQSGKTTVKKLKL